ncbi:MAG TPA: hypothetical protein VFV52_06395 [Bacilli bacterium]|nr:hypothetical protein [Bacilli bacterium]
MLTYDIIDSKLRDVKLLDSEQVVAAVEDVIARFELDAKRTTLSTYKGSVHWHLKQGKKTGLLEVTYWPQNGQLWVDIHDNRRKEWNLELIVPFSEALAEAFGGKVVLKEEPLL